jgi:hypothetical protein
LNRRQALNAAQRLNVWNDWNDWNRWNNDRDSPVAVPTGLGKTAVALDLQSTVLR